MPLFSSEEAFEYTLVPNSFIREYIKDAPGEYLKVYLYGLYFLCQQNPAGIKEFCLQLDMTYNEVVAAFEYWQQQGLIQIINGRECRFQYLKPVRESADILYTEQEYNITLQKLFGSRVLSSSDYQRIYDYTDQFGLNREVVPLLLEYCIKMKGKNISFSYIDKVAQTWAEQGVLSVSAADAEIARYEAGVSGASRVLNYLGIHRTPTPDEMQLYQKWTKEWGFTLDAIKTACVKTTGSRSPSMKYLDSILKALHEKGLTTSRTIHTENMESRQLSDKIKEVLRTVGLSDLAVSPGHMEYYLQWSKTFSHETILLAARQMSRYSNKSFEYFDKILLNWKNANLLSPEDIKNNMEKTAELQKKTQELFKLAGIKKKSGGSGQAKIPAMDKGMGVLRGCAAPGL